jgi:uncharacterized protein involved in outer membrane biogenesis
MHRPKQRFYDMTPRLRKRLIRFIGLPLLILLILIGIAVTLLFTQQQRLVHLAVKQLNDRLPGELVVGSSEISVFQNFPYISIALNRVELFSGKDTTARPLLQAERLYAGFSLPDILRQRYKVRAISLKNGHLDLVEDTSGDFNIVKAIRMTGDTTTKNGSASNLDLDVKKLVLKNLDLSFRDLRSRQLVTSHLDRIQADITDDSLRLRAGLQVNLVFTYTRPGDTLLWRNKHLETEIQVSYDKPTQLLHLPVGKIRLDNADFTIAGTVDLLHDNTGEFKFSGERPDFRQLFAFAPESVARELRHFKYDGQLNFNGLIKGPLTSGRQPLIELHFSCANAWLHNTEANKKLDSVSFTGFYSNGASHNLRTSELRLLNMRARPGEGVFNGNFVIRDFSDPKVLMQINSDLELGFIGAFLGIKDLQRITGHISLKMNLKELVDLSLPQKEMSQLTQGVQSELTVHDLTFRVPNYPYLIKNLNAHAQMKNGVVSLDTLSLLLGNSDFELDGSLSDLPALFHHQEKPVQLNLHIHSNQAFLKELWGFDSLRAARAREQIYGFNVGLSLNTSVNELLHPKPLPKGKFTLRDLSASFKRYPHSFHDFGAELTINDTAILLRNFAGSIDSSDIRFKGRVNNYALWFDRVKKGKTLIAFDLRSQHLAMNDLLGKHSRAYIPKDYRFEVGSNIWLRSRVELRYDSSFKFANIKIGNITGSLLKHPYQLDSVSGNVKFGTDNFVKIDSLKGKIGHSDFFINMRLYAGADTTRRKKENYLQFNSQFLDVDELTNYYVAAGQEDTIAIPESTASTAPVSTAAADSATAAADSATSTGTAAANPANPGGGSSTATPVTLAASTTTTTAHARAFNIFQIPFIDFNAGVHINRLRYHHLGIKNFATNMRMRSNQQLYLDTLFMNIAGGSIAASGQFNGADSHKIFLRSRIDVEDVNIEKLMLKLDYLGQDYVINKNIRGSLSGQVTSYLQVQPDLTPMVENSEARIDLEILNGTLVNFAPMHAISAYFKDKNLNMIRFDTLQNTLTFKNGMLSIPGMNINSSLGYMEISGQQSMDTHMEYYLRIPLKLVTQAGFHMLFGKKKEEVNPDQVDGIEYRDKEKKVRFMNLKIIGTPDDYKVSLGKAKKA